MVRWRTLFSECTHGGGQAGEYFEEVKNARPYKVGDYNAGIRRERRAFQRLVWHVLVSALTCGLFIIFRSLALFSHIFMSVLTCGLFIIFRPLALLSSFCRTEKRVPFSALYTLVQSITFSCSYTQSSFFYTMYNAR